MAGLLFQCVHIHHQAWRSNIPSHPRTPRWHTHCTAISAADEIAQLNPPPALQHTRLILVSPKEPGNVGAAMRLAENFEAYDVCIVAPRCDVHGSNVAIRSRQSRLLQLIQVADTLEDALAPCTSSVGFTRRVGGGRPVQPSLTALHAAFPALLQMPMLPTPGGTNMPKTALVFGREESGLTQEETDLCSHLCAIPTGRLQPSMNLSHAIAVVLSQVFHLQVGDAQQWLHDGLGQSNEACTAVPDDSQQHPGQPRDMAGTQQQRIGLYSAAERAGKSFMVGEMAAQRAVQPARLGEVEALVGRVERLAGAVGFDGGDSKEEAKQVGILAVRLRRVLGRARMTTQEVRTLHSLVTAIEKNLEK